jgi:hypothetical protein
MKKSVANTGTHPRGGWEVFCVMGGVPPWLLSWFVRPVRNLASWRTAMCRV